MTFCDSLEVTTLLGTVQGVDWFGHRVLLCNGASVPHDTLLSATGAPISATTNCPSAPVLKTPPGHDVDCRGSCSLLNRPRASDSEDRRALLAFCIIGGTATGVELTGIIADCLEDTAGRFQQHRHPQDAGDLGRAGTPRAASLSPEALEHAPGGLKRLGAEVRYGVPVTLCDDNGVHIGDEFLPTRAVI